MTVKSQALHLKNLIALFSPLTSDSMGSLKL